MEALEARLRDRQLKDGERILAITRMHGARHRLEERLARGAAHGLFDCITMDRMAWMLASRWRDRLAELGEKPTRELEFDETCRLAALLLRQADVQRWVAGRYPIVVVDEFQDCRDGRLAIVQALATTCDLLLAADEFQDLSGEVGTPAVEWLRTAGSPVDLAQIHRTDDQQLLVAADALRTGRKLAVGWGSGFSLVAAQNPNVGAAHIARAIHWSKGASLVVLSPTGPARSAFVRAVLARLAEKPFEEKAKKAKGKAPKTFGPYVLPWERSSEASDDALKHALNLPVHLDQEVTVPGFSSDQHLPGRYEVEQWFAHCRRVRGQTSFTVAEVHEAISRSVQHHRAHARPSRRIRAMTIWQAKNQEFDQVVVLWPFEVQGDGERLRRLLYNAVTRAKKKAVVVVQDFNGNRLTKPPFS
jgi:hypothetical protein